MTPEIVNGCELYLGDCLDILPTLAAGSVDLTVTSPPYDNLRTYNGYVFDFESIARELYRVTKPGGVVVWVVTDQTIDGSETGTSFRQALYFRELGFSIETMIYEVAGTGAKGSNNLYWQGFEFMFVFSKGNPKTVNRICDKKNITAGSVKFSSPKLEKQKTGRNHRNEVTADYGIRTNVWRYHSIWLAGDDITNHPAPFPEALARDHIISWSNPGDVVLDPMMGSGTTGKKAVELKRKFIGCECSVEYFEIAKRRILQAQPPLFVDAPAQPLAVQAELA